MENRAKMSKMFANGIGSLQPVVLKFTMRRGVGDRQFHTRQLRRLKKHFMKMDGSLRMTKHHTQDLNRKVAISEGLCWIGSTNADRSQAATC